MVKKNQAPDLASEFLLTLVKSEDLLDLRFRTTARQTIASNSFIGRVD